MRSCAIAAAFGAFLLLGSSAMPQDDEQRLADAQQAAFSMDKMLNVQRLSEEEAAQRRAWLRRTFAGTSTIAQMESGRPQTLLAARKPAEAIAAARAFIAQYPRYGSLHGGVLMVLVNICNDKTLSDAERRESFDVLLSNCQHAGYVLWRVQGYLQGMPLPPEEKYALAKRGEERAGTDPYARGFLCPFLEAYTRAAPAAEALAECERFLRRYDDSSDEFRRIRVAMLDVKAIGGDAAARAERVALVDRQKRESQESVALQKRLADALNADQLEEAERLVAELTKYPAWIRGSLGTARACLPRGDQTFRLRLLRMMIEHLPPSAEAEEVLLLLGDPQVSDAAEAADLAIEWWPKIMQSRGRDLRNLLFRIKAVSQSVEHQARAHRAVLTLCDRLEMTDAKAETLERLGLCLWDTDLPGAIDALRQAAEACPGSLASAEAAWLHDFLTGRHGVAQGALPRDPVYLAKKEPIVSVPLPAAPPGANDVVVNAGQYALRALNVKENLLTKCPATVSSGQASAAFLTDGRSETVWSAEAISSAVIVPLKQVSTVARVVLKMRDQARVIVTLLDPAGKPLAKYERDWRFWEQFRDVNRWSPVELTLNLVPVADVAFIRVDMDDPLGESCAVREMEAYAPAYPVQALHLLPPAPLPAGAAALTVTWRADQPVKEVTYLPNTESVRHWPVMRWSLPWRRPAAATGIQYQGPFLVIEFHGTNATVMLKEAGGALWNIDGVRRGEILHPDKDASDHLMADDLSDGRHLLTFENRRIPSRQDQFGPDGLVFTGLKVKGVSRVHVMIRFGANDGRWSDWLPVTEAGDSIAVPGVKAAKPYTLYQLGLRFDSRSVLASATASVQGITVSASGPTGGIRAPSAASAPEVFPEELAEAARLVSERKVVVAYPKVGTVHEYEAARRIANAARVYLVSDDIGLNLYAALVLSVGRPVSHRYCRQLLGMKMLWNDPVFLNNPDGVVGIQRDSAGQPAYLFATGETVEAVEKAAARLLRAVTPAAAFPDPFRCFSADTLESIYPWQIRASGASPKELTLRLGRNDRRSIQFGVAAEQKLDTVEVACTALTASAGTVLPPVIVRPVSFYEWVPFFGDLRLPNLLMNRSVFSLPANCATGVWLTVTTPKDAAPGLYSGIATVSANGLRVQLPLRITVEPVTLPDFMRAETMSFADVPYWFHEGTPAYERALRELARDEAASGVSVVGVRLAPMIRAADSDVPRTQAVLGGEAKPTVQPYTGQMKTLAPGQWLSVGFHRAIRPAYFYVTCSAAADSAISLDGHTAGDKSERLGKATITANPEARAIRFDGRNVESATWTVTNEGPSPVNISVVRAFLNPAQQWPFLVDFHAADRQMDVIEEVYRSCGKPPPAFCAYLSFECSPLLLEGGLFPPTSYRCFSEQLAEHLKQTGRLNRFYAKVGDEPGDIAKWTEWARPVRESGLITWTAHSGNYPNIDVAVGTMSFWCPNYAHDLKRPFWRERQKTGEKVWWYECGFPVTRLTGPLWDNLPFYWLTGKWRLDGAANFAAMYNNTTSTPVPFRYDHGMNHQIVILPDGAVLDTLRREVTGEGIRDCSLIFLIREKVETLRQRGDAVGADTLEQSLTDVLESVVPYKYGYATKPEVWHQARSTLYDLAR